MQKLNFNFIEITLSHGYSSVNMLHTETERLFFIFLVNTCGELYLYIVLNIEAVNVEVLSKKVKTIPILKTLFRTVCVIVVWWPIVSL